jgi:GT2 family glycosyltransferase
MRGREVTLSIVSHGQNALVNQLLGDMQHVCADGVTVVLTQNTPDPVPFAIGNLNCPVEVIVNSERKGFGANHNAAFLRCRTPFFCVANPDIRLPNDPFPALTESLESESVGVVGPLVRSPTGSVEDSARRFPTLGILIRKALGAPAAPDYPVDRGAQEVDWIGGMFMLFRSEVFRALSGFDQAYFLYYEDVDLCRRLRVAGKSVLYNPATEVVHDAQRASRRDPWLALSHARSAIRFLSRR